MLLGAVHAARGEGWSWSNPFSSKKDSAPPPKKPNANSSTGPSIPQLNGKPIHPASPPPAQPSMLSKIGAAPGTMWSKTKQAFTPAPKPAPSTKPTLGAKKPVTPSGGSSWNPFASKPTAPEQPHTTSEFIGLPRPGRELSAQ
jgi:hypothetical protein